MTLENNQKPLFSIILPLPAGAPSLCDTIASIRRQTYKNFELIIVDDGPASDTLNYALKAAESDSRIRVLSSENSRSSAFQGNEKVGPVSSRNAGILTAAGDYILFVSAGDFLPPTALQTIYDGAIAPRHPDIVLFGMISASEEERHVIEYPAGYYSRETLEKGVFPYMITDRRKKFYSACFPPDLHNRVISRKLLLRHYCREVRISHEEAHSFIHECMLNANDLYVIELTLYIEAAEPAWETAFDPSYLESNRCLMEYLEERMGSNPAIVAQLPYLKLHLLMKAVANAAKNPDGPAASLPLLKRSLRDTFALSGLPSFGLPLSARIFVSLLKSGHCRAAIGLAKLICG